MSKSLGTLTLDLVARIGSFTGPLDRASQEAKKRNAEIAKSFENLAKGVGVAIASVPAALTGLVAYTASSSKEISNLAALAGLGTGKLVWDKVLRRTLFSKGCSYALSNGMLDALRVISFHGYRSPNETVGKNGSLLKCRLHHSERSGE